MRLDLTFVCDGLIDCSFSVEVGCKALKASTNGKYGIVVSLRHQPDSTVILLCFVHFRNSLVSLVFPVPASPEIKIVFPLPLMACFRWCSSFASSCSLPTNFGSVKILDCNTQPSNISQSRACRN